ncbi:MAG TPA: putative 2OG-Fe(II) oxygenase [Steroidobacteraceae bacterium]|nr:putative 2OG-Fe(II) oxygenase [Steroidobacteraceae bacterium]
MRFPARSPAPSSSAVLFPSYFWHGTVPFASEQPRLTVAFDVVPAQVGVRWMSVWPLTTAP